MIPVYINLLLILAGVILIYKMPAKIGGLGGSFYLLFFTNSIAYLSFRIRNLSKELTLFLLIFVDLYFLNFQEFSMPKSIIDFYSLLIIWWFVILYILLIVIPFKNWNDISSEIEFKKIKEIFLYPVIFIGGIFNLISAITFTFIQEENHAGYSYLENLIFGIFIFSFFVVLFYSAGIKEAQIKKFLRPEKINSIEYNHVKFKKIFWLLFLFIIFFGSIGEMQRGDWFLWGETLLFLLLNSQIFWRIYRFYFKSYNLE